MLLRLAFPVPLRAIRPVSSFVLRISSVSS